MKMAQIPTKCEEEIMTAFTRMIMVAVLLTLLVGCASRVMVVDMVGKDKDRVAADTKTCNDASYCRGEFDTTRCKTPLLANCMHSPTETSFHTAACSDTIEGAFKSCMEAKGHTITESWSKP